MQKGVQENLSKEIYQKIYSMKYASIIKYGATYLTGAGRLDGAHIGESVYYVGPDTDCKITGYFVDPVILPDHQ